MFTLEIKPNVRRIFDVMIRADGKVIGFHHDYLYQIEQREAVQLTNKTFGIGGMHKAHVIVNEIVTLDKTFFPAEWTREQVISKIGEAMGNASKKYSYQGKTIYEGITSEGIKVRLTLNNIDNCISSTYPLFRP